MNQRYQGDGPAGQTRKSAASAKPVTHAASSVHIKKKPQTDSEKRAARKQREKEEQAKRAERARKAREKAEALAAAEAEAEAGDVVPGAKKPAVAAKGEAPLVQKSFLAKMFAPNPNMPQTEEYKKWRKIYWILIAAGVVCIAISLFAGVLFPPPEGSPMSTLGMVSLGGAYVVIIAAFAIDFSKVKPIVKKHQASNSNGNMTPKQRKHEQEARERAAAAEAARKAAKGTKKPIRRKKDDTVTPGDE
jgi:hypothetical protein